MHFHDRRDDFFWPGKSSLSLGIISISISPFKYHPFKFMLSTALSFPPTSCWLVFRNCYLSNLLATGRVLFKIYFLEIGLGLSSCHPESLQFTKLLTDRFSWDFETWTNVGIWFFEDVDFDATLSRSKFETSTR